MSIESLIYIADIVNGFSFLFFISGAVFIMLAVYSFSDENKPKSFVMIIFGLLLFIISILIPSKESVYIIAGVNSSKEFAKNIGDSELAKKTYQLIENKINEELEKSNQGKNK